MLQQMRRLSKSWISSIFLGVLALSFGVWGIADIFHTSADTSIASVGGEKISIDEFQRDYRNFLRNAGARLGHEVSSEEAHAKGLDKEALQNTINRTAVDHATAQYGLTASDAQVASNIRAIPAFRGPLGGFDHDTFLQRIQGAGYTEQSFVERERGDLAGDQLLVAAHGGFAFPLGYARLYFDYINEQRAAEYVVLAKDAVGPPPAANDADLAAYVKAHPAQFSTPEYRAVTYAVAGPQDVVSQIQVSEDQLKQQYELHKDEYQFPEKRDVDQITFPDEASAKTARAKLDAGTTFSDLAAQRGLKPADTSLATVVEADLGKDRGPAAFALPVGGATQPIKYTFGWVLLHVSKITPGVSKSFADVRDSLRKEVLNELATAKLTEVSNAFDDASAGGASLDQAAKRAGMRVVHLAAVDRKGLTSEGTKANLPVSPDFLAQLQKTEVGEEGDPFPSTDGNVYVIKVNGVTPPKLKPLSAVRAEAAAAWSADLQRQRMTALARLLAAQASTEKNLSSIASKLKVGVQSTGALGRDAASATLSPQLVRSLFDAAPGEVVSSPTADGSGIAIARVTAVQHPPDLAGNPYYQRFVENLSSEAGGDFDSSLATAVRAREGVTINQSQADRATGGS
ncbi:MAG TPA: SurA N-terminal domain-containing protein [Rhizomicrobium sp.]|jgi:peptidyl-prolyl cis-trans isomerase D